MWKPLIFDCYLAKYLKADYIRYKSIKNSEKLRFFSLDGAIFAVVIVSQSKSVKENVNSLIAAVIQQQFRV